MEQYHQVIAQLASAGWAPRKAIDLTIDMAAAQHGQRDSRPIAHQLYINYLKCPVLPIYVDVQKTAHRSTGDIQRPADSKSRAQLPNTQETKHRNAMEGLGMRLMSAVVATQVV